MEKKLGSAAEKQPNMVEKGIGKFAAKLRADDDMLEVLENFVSLKPAAVEKCTPEEARANPTPADAVAKVLQQQGRSAEPGALVPGVESSDRTIPGAASTLRARVYKPRNTAGGLPVILYFHGGGWVIADLDVYDGGARGLCDASGAIVISVDYRRAPEAKFPAAWDDALSAYQWVIANARELGGDGVRFGLAGESAGGNLAVATAIAARDGGLTVPRHVVAVYPVAQTGSTNTPSFLENAIAMPLNRAMIPWFLSHLLRDDTDKSDPRLDLVHAKLQGLPPVTIINATIDPLRDDGGMLAEALESAGNDCHREIYQGVTHEFFGMAAVVEKARQAQAFAGERLKAAFAAPLH